MINKILTHLQRLAEGSEKKIVLTLRQPLTAHQLARKLKLRPEQASALMERFSAIGLVRCLNPFARSSRVYWHTLIGLEFHRELATQACIPTEARLPRINWSHYGSVCFSHRATVIKTLTRPLQPAEIKRQARFNDPNLRMSANNARDVIRYLKAIGIVQPVYVKNKPHCSYELTDQGIQYQKLLKQAEVKE